MHVYCFIAGINASVADYCVATCKINVVYPETCKKHANRSPKSVPKSEGNASGKNVVADKRPS